MKTSKPQVKTPDTNPEVVLSQEQIEIQPAPEAIETETTVEQQQEVEKAAEEKKETPSQTVHTSTAPKKDEIIPQKSETLVKVEGIMQEGLEDIYLKMDPKTQNLFRQRGEEASQKIMALLSEMKIKVKKILTLIREWLLLIPNVNKFWLDQESKIKTDKIIGLPENKEKELV